MSYEYVCLNDAYNMEYWNTQNPPQISRVDVKKLKKILKGYGEYPEKYRDFIWRLLLKVPT